MGKPGRRPERPDEIMSEIMRIRVHPSTLDRLVRLAEEMEVTPSTMIRMCVEVVMCRNESAQVLGNVIRKVSDKIEKGEG